MKDIFEKSNNFVRNASVESNLLFGDYSLCKAPSISIIMPVFNRPDTFRESINSAIDQDYNGEYEIVVVDNFEGAISPNLDVVKSCNSSKVFYYKNSKSLGMHGNWNRGIELSRSPYITFCHDDDILLPNCLSRLLELQKETGEKLIISRNNVIDNKGKYIQRYSFPHKKYGLLVERDHYKYSLYNQFIASVGFGVGCLFSKKCMLDLGGYDESFYPSSDYALHAVYTYYYGCIINNIPTFNYRLADNESYNVYKQFVNVDKHFRECMAKRMHMPKCILRRIITANFNISIELFEKNGAGNVLTTK